MKIKNTKIRNHNIYQDDVKLSDIKNQLMFCPMIKTSKGQKFANGQELTQMFNDEGYHEFLKKTEKKNFSQADLTLLRDKDKKAYQRIQDKIFKGISEQSTEQKVYNWGIIPVDGLFVLDFDFGDHKSKNIEGVVSEYALAKIKAKYFKNAPMFYNLTLHGLRIFLFANDFKGNEDKKIFRQGTKNFKISIEDEDGKDINLYADVRGGRSSSLCMMSFFNSQLNRFDYSSLRVLHEKNEDITQIPSLSLIDFVNTEKSYKVTTDEEHLKEFNDQLNYLRSNERNEEKKVVAKTEKKTTEDKDKDSIRVSRVKNVNKIPSYLRPRKKKKYKPTKMELENIANLKSWFDFAHQATVDSLNRGMTEPFKNLLDSEHEVQYKIISSALSEIISYTAGQYPEDELIERFIDQIKLLNLNFNRKDINKMLKSIKLRFEGRYQKIERSNECNGYIKDLFGVFPVFSQKSTNELVKTVDRNLYRGGDDYMNERDGESISYILHEDLDKYSEVKRLLIRDKADKIFDSQFRSIKVTVMDYSSKEISKKLIDVDSADYYSKNALKSYTKYIEDNLEKEYHDYDESKHDKDEITKKYQELTAKARDLYKELIAKRNTAIKQMNKKIMIADIINGKNKVGFDLTFKPDLRPETIDAHESGDVQYRIAGGKREHSYFRSSDGLGTIHTTRLEKREQLKEFDLKEAIKEINQYDGTQKADSIDNKFEKAQTLNTIKQVFFFDKINKLIKKLADYLNGKTIVPNAIRSLDEKQTEKFLYQVANAMSYMNCFTSEQINKFVMLFELAHNKSEREGRLSKERLKVILLSLKSLNDFPRKPKNTQEYLPILGIEKDSYKDFYTKHFIMDEPIDNQEEIDYVLREYPDMFTDFSFKDCYLSENRKSDKQVIDKLYSKTTKFIDDPVAKMIEYMRLHVAHIDYEKYKNTNDKTKSIIREIEEHQPMYAKKYLISNNFKCYSKTKGLSRDDLFLIYDRINYRDSKQKKTYDGSFLDFIKNWEPQSDFSKLEIGLGMRNNFIFACANLLVRSGAPDEEQTTVDFVEFIRKTVDLSDNKYPDSTICQVLKNAFSVINDNCKYKGYRINDDSDAGIAFKYVLGVTPTEALAFKKQQAKKKSEVLKLNLDSKARIHAGLLSGMTINGQTYKVKYQMNGQIDLNEYTRDFNKIVHVLFNNKINYPLREVKKSLNDLLKGFRGLSNGEKYDLLNHKLSELNSESGTLINNYLGFSNAEERDNAIIKMQKQVTLLKNSGYGFKKEEHTPAFKLLARRTYDKQYREGYANDYHHSFFEYLSISALWFFMNTKIQVKGNSIFIDQPLVYKAFIKIFNDDMKEKNTQTNVFIKVLRTNDMKERILSRGSPPGMKT